MVAKTSRVLLMGDTPLLAGAVEENVIPLEQVPSFSPNTSLRG